MLKFSYPLLIVLLLPFLVHGQDPHLRQPESVEEILRKNNPEEFDAMINHDKYLVIDKIGSTKRKKLFIGQKISFGTTEDQNFIGDITRITDSTFTLTYFDHTSERYEIRLFYLNEISFMHKRILKKGLNYRFSPAFLLPFALDWIYFDRKPWENINALYYMSGIEVARIALMNRKKFFNKYKFNENRRLRVFQY